MSAKEYAKKETLVIMLNPDSFGRFNVMKTWTGVLKTGEPTSSHAKVWADIIVAAKEVLDEPRKS